MDELTESQRLDEEIFNAFSELIGRFMADAGRLAAEHGVPLFTIKAMHWLDGGLAMKELGRRLRCDPSFVTAIADELEERGLARREPDPGDRRVKNLVLTPEGRRFKARMEGELLAGMPWAGGALSLAERKTLLGLLHKLAGFAPCEQAPPVAAAAPAEEVSR